MPNASCNEAGCTRRATHQLVIKAENITSSLDGFTIPACEEHAPEIRKVVSYLCRGEAVAVEVVPLDE